MISCNFHTWAPAGSCVCVAHVIICLNAPDVLQHVQYVAGGLVLAVYMYK